MLKSRDQKIEELQRENFGIKEEIRRVNAACKAAESKLEGIESRQMQQVYELKLQLETKARIQMVASADPQESYARELSITYSNSDANEEMKRIKKNALDAITENKALTARVAELEKKLGEHEASFLKNPKVLELKGRRA